MAKNPNLKPAATAAAAAAVTATVIPPSNAALEEIKAQFTPARWEKITRQASTSCALDAAGLQALCTQLQTTRKARHPDNAAAALYAACNGLLLAIGSSLNPHDLSRYETAKTTGQTTPLPVDAPVPAAEAPALPPADAPAATAEAVTPA